MFGNVITNSKGWKTEQLGKICDLKAGKNIKAKDIYDIIKLKMWKRFFEENYQKSYSNNC